MRAMAIALMGCLTAATLPAAEPPAIGARVRALGPGGLEIEGTLAAYEADALTIEGGHGRGVATVGWDRIDRLEVFSRDRLAGLWRGALVGLAIALALAGPALVNGCEELECAVFAVPFVTIPLGALVGTDFAPRRWTEVPLPLPATHGRPGLGLRIAPVQGGARVALTYGF
jgi:hypothetical protein